MKRSGLHQVVVNSEEGHLTGLVEQVGEGDEGLGLLQIEDEDGGDEGHALNLEKEQTQASDWPTASAADDSGDRGGITHVTDVGSVTRVRSQHAVEEVVVGPALHANQGAELTDGGRGGRATKVRYLLEDEERRERSGDVQFDQIQAGLPVCPRRSFCREQPHQDHTWGWGCGGGGVGAWWGGVGGWERGGVRAWMWV